MAVLSFPNCGRLEIPKLSTCDPRGRTGAASSPRTGVGIRSLQFQRPTLRTRKTNATKMPKAALLVAIGLGPMVEQKSVTRQASAPTKRGIQWVPNKDRIQSDQGTALQGHVAQRTGRSPTSQHAADPDPVDSMLTWRRCLYRDVL